MCSVADRKTEGKRPVAWSPVSMTMGDLYFYLRKHCDDEGVVTIDWVRVSHDTGFSLFEVLKAFAHLMHDGLVEATSTKIHLDLNCPTPLDEE